MKGSFIKATKAYRILCLLSKDDATLRELATYFVEEENGEIPVPENQDEELRESIEQQERNINHYIEDMLDENLITSYKDNVMGEEKRHLSFDTERLAWLWIESMREFNSPRKTLDQSNVKEALGAARGEKVSDEEFLSYYKAFKQKEKESEFNPWYEFDAVASGHDPYNMIDFVASWCEDYMDDERHADSTILEMFEALEDEVTSDSFSELLNSGSTGEKDAEEVISTAVAHKRTAHTEERNGEEYRFPHIPHGGWKSMKRIPVIYSLRRKWKKFNGTLEEFIEKKKGMT